jgi:hypothetical protein
VTLKSPVPIDQIGELGYFKNGIIHVQRHVIYCRNNPHKICYNIITWRYSFAYNLHIHEHIHKTEKSWSFNKNNIKAKINKKECVPRITKQKRYTRPPARGPSGHEIQTKDSTMTK